MLLIDWPEFRPVGVCILPEFRDHELRPEFRPKHRTRRASNKRFESLVLNTCATMSFYLTVNSDADKDNSTAGQFTTSFNNAVNLDDDYKVAVVNVSQFQKSSPNEAGKNKAKAMAVGVAKPPAEYPKCTGDEITKMKAAYAEFNKTKDATYFIVTETGKQISFGFEFAYEIETQTISCFNQERITLRDLQYPAIVWESAHFVFQIQNFLVGMPIQVTAKKSTKTVNAPYHFTITPSSLMQKYLKLPAEIKFTFTDTPYIAHLQSDSTKVAKPLPVVDFMFKCTYTPEKTFIYPHLTEYYADEQNPTFEYFAKPPGGQWFPEFQQITSTRCIPVWHRDSWPCMYYSSPRIQTALNIHEVIGNDRGHEVLARDVNNREIKIPVYAQITKDIIEVCKQKIRYPEPHKLDWGAVTGDDNRLDIKYSANVRVALPYVFHYFTITTTAEDEQWTAKIRYKPANSNEEISEELKLSNLAQPKELLEKLQAAANSHETRTLIKFDFTEGGILKTVRTFYNAEVRVSRAFAIATGCPMIMNKAITENLHVLVWVAANIVQDSQVGLRQFPLLIPHPIYMTTQSICNPQYVKVCLTRFQHIDISIYTDIWSGSLYDNAYDTLLVLHFTPQKPYKRKICAGGCDTSKKPC